MYHIFIMDEHERSLPATFLYRGSADTMKGLKEVYNTLRGFDVKESHIEVSDISYGTAQLLLFAELDSDRTRNFFDKL